MASVYFDDDERSTVEKFLLVQRIEEMQDLYDILMPINKELDPALCRDKFLQQLFAEINVDWNETEPTSSTDTRENTIQEASPESSQDSRLNSTHVLHPDNEALMALSNFLHSARHIIKTNRLIDRVSLPDMSGRAFQLSVLTGRTDLRYTELLESIERSSLFFMFSRAISRLRIMQSISLDWGGMSSHELPHGLFMWSMDEFFKRCHLPGDVYLDVLTLNYSSDVLDWTKFSTDLLEILRYFKYFYTEIYKQSDYRKLMLILWDQEQLLNIGEQLDKDLNITMETFMNIDKQARNLTIKLWSQFNVNLVMHCNRRSMEERIRLPIEWRYVRKSYATLVEMQMLRDNEPVVRLEQEVQQLKESLTNEANASSYALTAYNVLISSYRSRYERIVQKHDIDLEHWENKILSVSFQLAKARDALREAGEKVDSMRQRVSEVRQLIAIERQNTMLLAGSARQSKHSMRSLGSKKGRR